MADSQLHRKIASYVQRLILQNPVAIIHYGSSVRPADYVPGKSDVDLLVISRAPLEDVDNDLGSTYFFVHPNDFISGLAVGNMFWLSALQSGRVLYDPHGFVAAVQQLEATGFEIKPGLIALQNCIQLTDTHISAAISRYFWYTPPTAAVATDIARAIYASAKGIGGFCAIASTGRDPHGFSAIKASVSPYPDIVELMQHSRALHESQVDLAALPSSHRRINAGDVLGSAILEVERARVEYCSLTPGRRLTNDIIDEWTSISGELDKCLMVRITHAEHLVLGRSGPHLVLFGTLHTNSARPRFTHRTLEWSGSLSFAQAQTLLGSIP